MNRTDAAAILSIDPSASADEAKRAYQELFTEHQVRLTNAPTPALRSLYQARLLELDEARDAFLANSLSDADADLPTDQPSIPTYGRSETAKPQATPPPPPPVEKQKRAQEPPPPREQKPTVEPQRSEPVREAAPPLPPKKKSAASKWAGIVIGGGVVLLALTQVPRLLNSRSSDGTTSDSSSATTPKVADSDSLPKIRENITVARVEFGRGDYDAANGALKEADSFYSRIGSDARTDTAVVEIKSQLDSLHAKVQRACDALKRVAERHPGERTCKSL